MNPTSQTTKSKDKPIRVARAPIYLGADPEFFFKLKGKIVGSEKIIPPNGTDKSGEGAVVRDGIQGELQIGGSYCREILANHIAYAFRNLNQWLTDTKELSKTKIMISQQVEVTKAEMDSLSDNSKQLGCMPSLNIYNSKATVGVDDPMNMRKRTGGGHIHIGCPNGFKVSASDPVWKKLFRTEPQRVVQMLDIIAGNTCVLIDRDKGNIERRKQYGRAGEYRLPSHGLEYRTLSNFWLQSYTLMSLATSLVRLAVSIVYSTEKHESTLEKEILELVNQEDVTKAINENNFDLAKANFDKIKHILADAFKQRKVTVQFYGVTSTEMRTDYVDPPFTTKNLAKFEHFIAKTKSKGLKYWQKEELKDPMLYWLKRIGVATAPKPQYGWESFLSNVVAKDYQKKNKTESDLTI